MTRLLVLFVLLLGWGSQAFAAWGTPVAGAVASDADPRTGTALTINLPASTSVGETLVALVAYRHGQAGSWTTPSGWTLIGDQGNSGTEVAMFCREADSTIISAGNQGFVGSIAGNSMGRMFRASGGTCTVHAEAGLTSDTLGQEVPVPALTITQANTLVVYGWMLNWNDAASGVTSYPNSATGLTADGSSFGSNEMSIGIGYRIQTTASSLSSGNIDLVSTSNLRRIAIAVSLSEAAAPSCSGTIGNQTYTEGTAITTGLLGTWSCTGATSYSLQGGCSSGAPAGLTMNTSTASWSGTPAGPTPRTACVIRAANGGATTDSPAFNIAINPPATFSYVTVAGLPWAGGAASVLQGLSPAAVNGDVIKAPASTTSPVYAYTQNADGTFVIAASGYTGLISWTGYVWDTSANAYYTAFPIAVNNPGPVCTPPSAQIVVRIGVAADVLVDCSHAEGLTLTGAVTTGTVPTGLSFGSSTLRFTGTATVENESGAALTITVTDTFGDTATPTRTIYPIDTLAVPSCVGSDATSCASLLESRFLDSTLQQRCRRITVPNTVLSQSPAAAAEVAPFSTIALTASKACPFMDWGR